MEKHKIRKLLFLKKTPNVFLFLCVYQTYYNFAILQLNSIAQHSHFSLSFFLLFLAFTLGCTHPLYSHTILL